MHTTDPVGAVVAANLKRFRQARRWTLKETAAELAVQLGREPLTEAGLARWEDSAKPRRFAMTELFAICQVFGRPLSRLFLPDLDEEIPTVQGQPFFAVWNACFEGSESASTDWQRVAYVQRKQLPMPGDKASALDEFTEQEITEAVELLRRSRERSAEAGDGEEHA